PLGGWPPSGRGDPSLGVAADLGQRPDFPAHPPHVDPRHRAAHPTTSSVAAPATGEPSGRNQVDISPRAVAAVPSQNRTPISLTKAAASSGDSPPGPWPSRVTWTPRRAVRTAPITDTPTPQPT